MARYVPLSVPKLQDYIDQGLRDRPGTDAYTHVVLTKDGREFSIHRSKKAAQERAAKLSGATVAPWTPKETTRYDYLYD